MNVRLFPVALFGVVCTAAGAGSALWWMHAVERSPALPPAPAADGGDGARPSGADAVAAGAPARVGATGGGPGSGAPGATTGDTVAGDVGAPPALGGGGADAGVASAGGPDHAPRAAGGALRWLALGGGPTPDSNQLSIEADFALAARVLGPEGGRMYFAGGPASSGVQVADPSPRGDTVLAELGALFAPRAGRDAHYRQTVLPLDGEARAATALEALRVALAAADDTDLADGGLARGRRPVTAPVTVYLAGHGEQGEGPAQIRIPLWVGPALTPVALAEVLDGSAPLTLPPSAPPAVVEAARAASWATRRPVRVIATTCFSGGFAELAFTRADPAAGPAATPRCGLFAAPWDDEASGCDPDPDRRVHEGYGVHFFHALRGEDRDGHALPPGALDLDGDGVVSLLEAHTRVRLASRAPDVPTTTSERWLRQRAPEDGPSEPVALPEEAAVVATLGARLGLARGVDPEADSGAARDELDRLSDSIEAARKDADAARDDEDAAFLELSGRLLARWPVLDDPWHPDWAPMWDGERAEIAAFLERSPEFERYRGARDESERRQAALESLRVAAAPVERLVRAFDTLELAGRLRAVGGEDWAHFERLRACERGTP